MAEQIKDAWGGVRVAAKGPETDQWGGVRLSSARKADEWGGVAVGETEVAAPAEPEVPQQRSSRRAGEFAFSTALQETYGSWIPGVGKFTEASANERKMLFDSLALGGAMTLGGKKITKSGDDTFISAEFEKDYQSGEPAAVFAAEAIKAIPSMGAGMAAASSVAPYARRVGQVVSAFPAPGARAAGRVISTAAPLVAGGIAAIGTRMGQEALVNADVLPEPITEAYRESAIRAEESPTAAVIGQMAGIRPFLKPGLPLNTRGPAVPVLSGVIGGGVETGAQLATEGEIDPGRIAVATLGNAILNRETRLGRAIAPNMVASPAAARPAFPVPEPAPSLGRPREFGPAARVLSQEEMAAGLAAENRAIQDQLMSLDAARARAQGVPPTEIPLITGLPEPRPPAAPIEEVAAGLMGATPADVRALRTARGLVDAGLSEAGMSNAEAMNIARGLMGDTGPAAARPATPLLEPAMPAAPQPPSAPKQPAAPFLPPEPAPSLANISAKASSMAKKGDNVALQQTIDAINSPATEARISDAGAVPAPARALPEPLAATPQIESPTQTTPLLAAPPAMKQKMIRDAVATAGVDYQYSVFRPGMKGVPDVVQVDVIAPDRSTSLVSSNPTDLRAAGADLPDVPAWVPQGRYTKAEMDALIKQGEPKVAAPKRVSVDDEGIIARTNPRPRADIDNGTLYTEWRVRKITSDDLNANETLRRKSGQGDYVVERRVVRTDGDTATPAPWEAMDSGTTKRDAIVSAWEPSMMQAKSLDKTHKSIVDADQKRVSELRKKEAAEQQVLADKQARQREYVAAVKQTKLPKGQMREIDSQFNNKDGVKEVRRVPATVYGDWAIRKDDASKQAKYVVMHVPSGLKATGKPTIAEAKEVVQAFIYSGVDARSPQLAADKAALQKMMQAINGLNANMADPPPWFTGRRPARSNEAGFTTQARNPADAGFAAPGVMAPLGGAAAGAVAGVAAGDTPEEKLRYGVVGALAGAVGGRTLAKALDRTAMRSKALRSIQEEAVGKDAMPAWYNRLKTKEYRGRIGAALSPLRWREAINNTRVRIKDLVTELSDKMKVADEDNPFLLGKLYPGRVTARIQRARDALKSIEDRVKEAAKASGQKYEDFLANFNLWMEARHTPYYNQAVLNRTEPGEVPRLHRLSDKEASDIFNELSQNGMGRVYDDLAKEYADVSNGSLDLLVQAGVLDADVVNGWRKAFPHYVPFNRIDPNDVDDLVTVKTLGGGPGLNVFGSGRYTIKGSDRPVADIAGSISANFFDAIQRAERNRVNSAFYRLVSKAAQAGKPVAGISLKVPTPTDVFDPAHMLSVRVGGKNRWMVFEDPKMATAASNLNAEQLTGLFRLIGMGTRLFSGLVTRWSPNFQLINPLRDRQEAAQRLLSQGDVVGAARLMSPASAVNDVKGVAQWIAGIDSPDAALFEQMFMDGGLSGGYASMTRKTAEELIADARKGGSGFVQHTKENLEKFIDFVTDISEGSTRFAAYKRALELGATPDQAALAARNASVDFNMKGTVAPQAGALFAFFNPAVQGPINMAKAGIRSPEAAANTAVALLTIGAVVDKWNSAQDPQWKERPAMRYMRTSGIPIIYGKDETTGEQKVFTYPIAYGLRPFKAIMDFGYGLNTGEINEQNAADKLAETFGVIVDSTNPFGTSNIKTAWAPTLARPVIEVLMNESWTGAPIVPKWMDADPLLAERAKRMIGSYNKQTGKMAIEGSEFLYNQFGLDVSPERMGYLIRQYSGGPGRTFSDFINTSPKLAKAFDEGKMPELNAAQTPLASAFFRRVSPEIYDTGTPDYERAREFATKIRTDKELLRQQAAVFYRQNLATEPPSKWLGAIREAEREGTISATPEFLAAVERQAKNALTAFEGRGRLVKEMNVKNGDRARFFASEMDDIPPEQWQAYVNEQVAAGLWDATVDRQVRVLMGRPNQ